MRYGGSILVFSITLLASALGQSTSTLRLVPRFAYVANDQDDTVSIFAIEKAKLRSLGYAYVGAGSGPRAVAVTPSQRFLYAANTGAGISGYAIDSTTGALTPVQGSPFATGPEFAVAVHPSEKFLISANGSNICSYMIDAATGSIRLVGCATSDSASSVGVYRSGSFVYATNERSNSVSAFAIDPTTGVLIAAPGSPFAAGSNPKAAVIDPSGNYLYVPNGGGANVSAYAINPGTGALTQVPGSPFATG